MCVRLHVYVCVCVCVCVHHLPWASSVVLQQSQHHKNKGILLLQNAMQHFWPSFFFWGGGEHPPDPYLIKYLLNIQLSSGFNCCIFNTMFLYILLHHYETSSACAYRGLTL